MGGFSLARLVEGTGRLSQVTCTADRAAAGCICPDRQRGPRRCRGALHACMHARPGRGRNGYGINAGTAHRESKPKRKKKYNSFLSDALYKCCAGPIILGAAKHSTCRVCGRTLDRTQPYSFLHACMPPDKARTYVPARLTRQRGHQRIFPRAIIVWYRQESGEVVVSAAAGRVSFACFALWNCG